MTPRDLQRLQAVRLHREQKAAAACALQRHACLKANAALVEAREHAQARHERLLGDADALNARAAASALPVRQWLAAQAEVDAQHAHYLAALEAVETARQVRSQHREHQLERARELRRCQRRVQAWDSLVDRMRREGLRLEECHDEQEQGERLWSSQEVIQ